MVKFLLLILSLTVFSYGQTVYEDAEDGAISRWSIYGNDQTEATVSNIYDTNRGSRTIVLNGDGLNNRYMLGAAGGWGYASAWNNQEEKRLRWSMKYNEDFRIYVFVQTLNGHRLLTYSNSNNTNGIINFGTIHHGLGQNSSNNTWQTFTRDLESDLHDVEENNSIVSVNAFSIAGSGSVDDITLLHNVDSAPVLTINGPTTIHLLAGSTYTEAGATAYDQEDGNLNNAIVIDSSSVDTNTAGSYEVLYSVTDNDGNTVTARKTVVVIPTSEFGTLTGEDNNFTGKHIGSGVGGSMFGVAIDPTNTNNILTSGDMGLVYHTTNGGTSWEIIPNMYKIRFIEFDTLNPNIVWAGGELGLYKSVDGGQNWHYSFCCHEAGLGAVAIDPNDSNIIYAAQGYVSRLTVSWVSGFVWKSIDGGNTWRKLNRPTGNGNHIQSRNYTTIVIDPNSTYEEGKGHSRVYLMGRHGLFKSEDFGEHWEDITFFEPGQGSDLVLINKNGQSHLFVAVIPVKNYPKKGVYRSDDAGASWVENNSGLSSIISRLEVRNRDINRRAMFSLMLSACASDSNRLYVGSWQGIARSNNMGANWQQTTPAETTYIKHVSNKYIPIPSKKRINESKTFQGGIDNFMRIKTANSNADIVLFSDNDEVHLSTDAGNSWRSISFDYTDRFVESELVIPTLADDEVKNRYTHCIKSRGVQSTVNTDIAVDPFDPQVIYATYMDIGTQISRDGGISWEHPTIGLPARGHSWSVVVDPQVEGRLWVGAGYGYVYISNDKGHTWERLKAVGASTGQIVRLAIDSRSDVTHRVLYAATKYKGLYKSEDGGQSWHNILDTNGITDVKLDPSNKDIIYAGTNHGLYKSIDKGENWTKIGDNNFGKVWNISTGKNNTLYLIANNESGGISNYARRELWKSIDEGETFIKISPHFMKYVGGVVVDPNDSEHLYIINYRTSSNQPWIMAHSTNGGISWKEIAKGTASILGQHAYIDPSNHNRIFFNTNFSLIEVTHNQ